MSFVQSPPALSHKPAQRSCTHVSQSNARNLVVCIDGTSNKFGHNNTNVVKLFSHIDLESTNQKQLAYYSSGIGTNPKKLEVQRRLSDRWDMAIAWNLEEIVKDAYGWLARMYQDGDKIYLFGFSRGAYQVRVLAGMIHEVGLIRTPTEKQIGMAYDHYEEARSGKSAERQLAREFKNTFSWDELKVHFIGVWDTVSAVGFIRRDVSVSSSSSATHACHFRHALALDERRVKFMPEYFREMNSRTEDVKSRYIPDSTDKKSNMGIAANSADIKEVWFAGSHSDVGGRSGPGKFHQAGNASLLWMRREAIASGLMLKPTDIVCVPDDIDLGVSDSMSAGWRIAEYVHTKHQVSFSGAGEDGWRFHLAKPRRVIPGQRVHASVFYTNTYEPQASLGEGFDIPIVHAGLNTKLDDSFWEIGLFDDTTAQELVVHCSSEQGVPSIYLDRLLFVLRFDEGKQCIRKLQSWPDQFINLIRKSNVAPLVRLVAIVACYEISCDPDKDHTCSALPEIAHIKNILSDIAPSILAILREHKHQDGARVSALLGPLTKHRILRECVLTDSVLDALMKLLDAILKKEEGCFGQLMDGLNCLLLCADTQKIIVRRLGENRRLFRILQVDDTHLLTAALRMVMTLARIPEARAIFSEVKTRLKYLASAKNKGLVGPFAVKILLSLYEPSESPLNIRDSHVRANLARAFICFNSDRRDSADDQVGPRKEILRTLFGFGATRLNGDQEKLIRELKSAVQKSDARERTAATLTLLKLCESDTILEYLVEIKLLDVFLGQLRSKSNALLAAYALATCLKYPVTREFIMNSELAKNIVYMLRLDYFDDAIGSVEGFQIFGTFMQHDDLREKIRKYDITEVLYRKLREGKRKETRTSLICLDIFRAFDERGPWTSDLVEKGLECLRDPAWKVQKAGVTILSSLAQTESGVAAISLRMVEIISMLLPKGSIQSPTTPPNNDRGQPLTESKGPECGPPTSGDVSQRTPGMMGPACALRILAQNKTLRDATSNTVQYKCLKNFYQSGTLVGEAETKPWHVYTPIRTDIIGMLEKMIKAVDEELLEDGLMAIGDDVLPHIEHWGRLLRFIADMPVAVLLTLLSAPLIVIWACLGFVAAPVVFPVLWLLKRMQEYRIARNVDKLRGTRGGAVNGHEGEKSLASRFLSRVMRTRPGNEQGVGSHD